MSDWLPAGPEVLGIEVAAEPRDDAGGWQVRDLRIPRGLDGPKGILQGGLAAAIGIVAAQHVDPFGAPLTAVTARLEAPGPLGTTVELAVRPGDGAAHYRTELRAGATRLVSTSVEFAGRDPAPIVADLLELAHVPLPEPQPNRVAPYCWICGSKPRHPAAQRRLPAWHGDAVVIPWVVDEQLADASGSVDPLVVSAALDCPGVWSAWPRAQKEGWATLLLAGYEVRWFRDVPAMEPLRLVARCDAIDGRKVRVRTAIIDEDDATYAMANALHIAVAELPRLPLRP